MLYIDDFASVSEKLFYVLFADDTKIFLNGKYLNKLVEIIQSELFKLYNWLQMNKLTLNLPKTHFMVSIEQNINLKTSPLVLTLLK